MQPRPDVDEPHDPWEDGSFDPSMTMLERTRALEKSGPAFDETRGLSAGEVSMRQTLASTMEASASRPLRSPPRRRRGVKHAKSAGRLRGSVTPLRPGTSGGLADRDHLPEARPRNAAGDLHRADSRLASAAAGRRSSLPQLTLAGRRVSFDESVLAPLQLDSPMSSLRYRTTGEFDMSRATMNKLRASVVRAIG